MPQDKDFKRKVRAQIAVTGEAYTAARAALERGDQSPPPPSAENWERWIELLAVPQHADGAQALLESLPPDGRRHAAVAGLAHDDWRVRRRCCQLLDDLALTEESTEAMRACLDDPEPKVRQAAMHSLACVHCKPDGCALDLRQLFERMIGDPSATVRKAVVGPLSWNVGLQEPWGVAILERVAQSDPSTKLRAVASKGLASIERRRSLAAKRLELPDELRAKTERHRGKWVAIADGRIITAHRSPGQVRKQMRGTGNLTADVYWVGPD